MTNSPSVSVPKISDSDQRRVLGYVAALKLEQIREHLREADQRVSGTKAVLIERLETAIDAGATSYEALIALLDRIEPWNKQHVFLYDGPKSGIAKWCQAPNVEATLKAHKLGRLFNAKKSLALPSALELSSVVHTPDRLEVVAIKRRDAWERDEGQDSSSETDLGETVELRAYVHKVYRVLVRLEWDLRANTAMVQMSQMSRRDDYQNTLADFLVLIKWLPTDAFSPIDLRRAIRRFHELEEKGPKETRSHGIGYMTIAGRQLEGKSAAASAPLFGEAIIDGPLASLRDQGVARHGNFYFVHAPHIPGCPLHKAEEVHAVISGGETLQVTLPTANTEDTVRYVLSRVRDACK